jgi:hypothetical protein
LVIRYLCGWGLGNRSFVGEQESFEMDSKRGFRFPKMWRGGLAKEKVGCFDSEFNGLEVQLRILLT